MSEVKQLVFKATLKGCGGVNFDSLKTARPMLEKWYESRGDANALKQENGKRLNNIKCLKSDYVFKDGKIERAIKISSQCLRHNIFADALSNYCLDIHCSDKLSVEFLTSPAVLLRGTLNADTTRPSKRKSPFTIVAAKASPEYVPYLNFTTNHASRVEKAKSSDSNNNERGYTYNLPETSIVTAETVGEIEYTTRGFLDIKELRFLSLDDRYLREYINSDNKEEALRLLNEGYDKKDHAIEGAYLPKHCVCGGVERGIYLSNKQTLDIVKYWFRLMLKLEIKSGGPESYAGMSKLEYAVIDSDTMIGNVFDSGNVNFIEIKLDDIDSLDLKFETAYNLVEGSESSTYGILETEIVSARDKVLKAASAKDKEKEKKKEDVAKHKATKKAKDEDNEVTEDAVDEEGSED